MMLSNLKKRLWGKKGKKNSGVNKAERRKERMIYLKNKLVRLYHQGSWIPRTYYLAYLANYELNRLAEKLGIKEKMNVTG